MGSVLFLTQPAATGLNPGSAEIFSLLFSSWTVRPNPPTAYAKIFAYAVSGEGQS